MRKTVCYRREVHAGRYPYDLSEGGKYFDLVMMIVSQVPSLNPKLQTPHSKPNPKTKPKHKPQTLNPLSHKPKRYQTRHQVFGICIHRGIRIHTRTHIRALRQRPCVCVCVCVCLCVCRSIHSRSLSRAHTHESGHVTLRPSPYSATPETLDPNL